MKCPSLSLVIFVLKSVLFCINIASAALLWSPFLWYVFLPLLTSNPFLLLNLKCVFCRQHIVESCFLKIVNLGTSLVAHWLRIRLPMQGTQVRSLVRENPTCCGATKPVRHNYWACALEPAIHSCWARVPQLLRPTCLEPMLRNKRSHHNKKPMHHNEE